MTRFTVSRPGLPPLRTDCPEIALMFGGKLLDSDAERLAWKTLLQPHLDVQEAIRTLLRSGLSVLSDHPDAKAVCERIGALNRQTVERLLGVCTVTVNGTT